MTSVPKQGHSTVSYRDHLLVFGGRSQSGKLLNDTWKVTAERAERLQVKGKLPEERDYHTAHIYDNMMYVVHGHVLGHIPSLRYSLPVLDLETHTWNKLMTTGDVPQALVHHASAIVGPTIYVTGGYEYQATNRKGDGSSSSSSSDSSESDGGTTPSNVSQFYELNTESLIWTEIQVSGVAPRLWGHSAVVRNSMMLIFGGVNKATGRESNTLWGWNFLTRNWSAITPMTVVATRDFTGTGPDQLSFKAGQVIQVVQPPRGQEWGKGTIGDAAGAFPAAYAEYQSPSHRSLHVSVATDTGVLVWGGEIDSEGNKVRDSWALDPVRKQWSKIPQEGAPHPQGGLSGAWHNSHFVVPVLESSELYYYNTNSKTWSKKQMQVVAAPPSSIKRAPSSMSSIEPMRSRTTDPQETAPVAQPASHPSTVNQKSPVVVYVMQSNNAQPPSDSNPTVSSGAGPAGLRSRPAESPQEPSRTEERQSPAAMPSPPTVPDWAPPGDRSRTSTPSQAATPLSSVISAPAPVAPLTSAKGSASRRASRSSSLVRHPALQPGSPHGTPASQHQQPPANFSTYNTPISTYLDHPSYNDDRQSRSSRPGGPGGERAQELVCPQESESPQRSRFHGLGGPGCQPRHLSSCHSPKYEASSWGLESHARPSMGTPQGHTSMQSMHSPTPASPRQGHMSMGHVPRTSSPSSRFRRTSFSPTPPLMASPRWPGNRP